MGVSWRQIAKSGEAPRIWLPGRVGFLVREVRANVRRIERAIDAHDRRCCLCGGSGATFVRAFMSDPVTPIRCAQRVSLVSAWCAEYDEQLALEWLLGLREAVTDSQMCEWGLEVARVGA